jgi:hypothetical protein
MRRLMKKQYVVIASLDRSLTLGRNLPVMAEDTEAFKKRRNRD